MVASALGLVLFLTVLVLFATWVTSHVLLFVRLVPRYGTRAVLGLIAFPIAPYYGLKAGLRGLSLCWLLSLTMYLGALLLAWL